MYYCLDSEGFINTQVSITTTLYTYRSPPSSEPLWTHAHFTLLFGAWLVLVVTVDAGNSVRPTATPDLAVPLPDPTAHRTLDK